MKKKFIYFLLICLLFLGFLIMMPVRADSGWDTDYDSDSSWDSGSSWDTGSSGYYHSSSPASGGVAVIITIVVIVIIVMVIAQENKKKTSSNIKISNVINYNDITEEKLQSFDDSLTLEKFKEEVFNIYKDIQEAWMNFATDKIRNLTTDELYNM